MECQTCGYSHDSIRLIIENARTTKKANGGKRRKRKTKRKTKRKRKTKKTKRKTKYNYTDQKEK